MQSPLSGFCEVLKEVKKRAREYPPINETQTRMALIDPVLTALGWDLTNAKMVELERHFMIGRERYVVDYVLKADNQIIVEAKNLGADLGEHFNQIAIYANSLRVKNLFLTDGRTWVHYINSHQPVEGQPQAINFSPAYSIKLHEIDGLNLSRDAAYLVAHLDASLFMQHQETNVAENDLHSQIAELKVTIREISAAVRNLSGGEEILPTQVAPDSRPWKSITDNGWNPTGKRPTRLRLEEGLEIDVSGWTQVLWNTCQYCLTTKSELMESLPIKDCSINSRRNLVGTAMPAYNNKELTINDQVVYVDCTYSAIVTLKNVAYMLGKLGEGASARAAVLLAEKP